jgi:hypothetical protein
MAKDFLQYPAWQTIAHASNRNTFTFVLPRVKPSIVISKISYSEDEVSIEHAGSSNAASILASTLAMPTLELEASPARTPSPPSASNKTTTPRAKRGKSCIVRMLIFVAVIGSMAFLKVSNHHLVRIVIVWATLLIPPCCLPL